MGGLNTYLNLGQNLISEICALRKEVARAADALERISIGQDSQLQMMRVAPVLRVQPQNTGQIVVPKIK